MIVKISIPEAYTAIELDEKRAYQTFLKLNEVLLSLQIKTAEREQEKIVPSAACMVETRQEEGLEKEEKQGKEVEAETEAAIRPQYRGFMYIRCPNCGEMKGFYTKKESDHYHCDNCGARSVYEEKLVPLQVNCECGRKFRYQTNVTETAFDIPCLVCGSPVYVEWNEKKAAYETIG